MPLNKPQHLKSLNTINLQPQKLTPKTDIIMYMDLGGATNKKIAEAMSLTEGRVSIIRTCPLYKERIEELRSKMEKDVREKMSEKIVAGDPVETLIRDACLLAAQKKIDLINNATSEFVQNAAAGDILGIGGYQRKTTKTTTVIEIDQKQGERFERILRDGHNSDERKHKIRVTQEMSE